MRRSANYRDDCSRVAALSCGAGADRSAGLGHLRDTGYATSRPDHRHLNVCLSSRATQPIGSMTIHQVDALGGTFTSSLSVVPKFVFTNTTNASVVIYDTGAAPLPVTFTGDNGRWMYDAPASLHV